MDFYNPKLGGYLEITPQTSKTEKSLLEALPFWAMPTIGEFLQMAARLGRLDKAVIALREMGMKVDFHTGSVTFVENFIFLRNREDAPSQPLPEGGVLVRVGDANQNPLWVIIKKGSTSK